VRVTEAVKVSATSASVAVKVPVMLQCSALGVRRLRDRRGSVSRRDEPACCSPP